MILLGEGKNVGGSSGGSSGRLLLFRYVIRTA